MLPIFVPSIDGLVPYRPRLFKGVYTGTKVTVKRAVDEDVFRKLSIPVADERLESTRLLFLLLFMLRGMPFVDVAYLRHCDFHNNVIVYRRKKTGAWLTVRVEGKALEIIRSLRNSDENSPYLFPLIHNPGKDEYRQYQNALRGFNYRLKKLKDHIKRCDRIDQLYGPTTAGPLLPIIGTISLNLLAMPWDIHQ